MSVIRIGTPEDAKEGAVLEKGNGGNRYVLRGWYQDVCGGVVLIPPRYISRVELFRFLGLRMPAQPRGRYKRRRKGEEVPS